MTVDNVNSVIIVCSIVLVVMAIAMTLFIIDAKRYIHTKDTQIDLLEKGCQKEIELLKKEINQLKKDKVDKDVPEKLLAGKREKE